MKLALAYLHSAVQGGILGAGLGFLFGLYGILIAVLMAVWGIWSAHVLVNHDIDKSIRLDATEQAK